MQLTPGHQRAAFAAVKDVLENESSLTQPQGDVAKVLTDFLEKSSTPNYIIYNPKYTLLNVRIPPLKIKALIYITLIPLYSLLIRKARL